MTDSAGLAASATTDHTNGQGIVIAQIKDTQGCSYCSQMCVALPKIVMSSFIIDSDATIAIWEEAYASYSRFTPSHTVVVFTFGGVSQGRFSFFTLPQ
jgi:hypothetical protein